MKTLRFKTNLKCNHCVAKVREQLDAANLGSWSVDLQSPDRVLTLETAEEHAEDTVKKILSDAGYRAEVCPG